MSYKLKNTLILIANNIIIGTLGMYFTQSYYPKQLETLSNESNEYNAKIAGIPERKNYLNELIEKIEVGSDKFEVEEKQIYRDVSLAEVLSFVDAIHKRSGHFSFSLSELIRSKHDSSSQIIFSLAGEGQFNSIYALIRNLEKGKLNLKINELQLINIEKPADNKSNNPVDISFEMSIAAYPSLGDSNNSSIDVTNKSRRSAVNNIFSPVISSNIAPNSQKLVESERSELRAILPDNAIVEDHRGQLVSLQEGDRVYLGYLTKIDRDRNRIIFTLNKGGIVKDQILAMSFSK